MTISKYPITKNGVDFLVKISNIYPIYSRINIKKKTIFGFSKSVYNKCYWNNDLSDIIKDDDFLIKFANIGIEDYIRESKVECDIVDRANRQEKEFKSWNGIIK